MILSFVLKILEMINMYTLILQYILLLFVCVCMSTVLHEAVCTGDPEIVQIVLQHRDFQRYSKRTVGVPDLLKRLREVSTIQAFKADDWTSTLWCGLVFPSYAFNAIKDGYWCYINRL